MSGSLEPRGPAPVPQRPTQRPLTNPTSSEQGRPEPGRRLLYDQVGPTWDNLDANLRRALRQAGLCQDRPLIEVVDPPRVLRRAGAVRHQQVATWASETQLVVITCTRPLAPAGPGRYRPTGAWEGEADVAHLADAQRTEHAWGGARGDELAASDWSGAELPVARGPVELLHPGLAAQLSATAQSWARALDSPRRFTETLYFVEDLGRTVRLIRAERASAQQATLVLAPWAATMVVAAVERRERIRLVTRPATRLPWPRRGSIDGGSPELHTEPRPQLAPGRTAAGDAGTSSDEDRPARGWIARQIERGRP